MTGMVTWLPGVLRAAGLDVAELPGCATRTTRSSGLSVLGVVGHHTATSTRWLDGHVAALLRDGRRDLAGPLAQLGLERDGTFAVIALGRCNHNGYGKWGNDSIGIEAYNDGVGEPWPLAQVDAYVRGVAAILAHLGLSADHFLGHRETDPGRKIDPAGLDMADLRRTIAALMEEPDMPLSATDLEAIGKVVEAKLAAANEAQYSRIRTMATRLRDSLAALIRKGFGI